jgi:hypothetical protein
MVAAVALLAGCTIALGLAIEPAGRLSRAAGVQVMPGVAP